MRDSGSLSQMMPSSKSPILVYMDNQFSQTLPCRSHSVNCLFCRLLQPTEVYGMFVAILSCVKWLLLSINKFFQFFSTPTKHKSRTAFSKRSSDHKNWVNTCGKIYITEKIDSSLLGMVPSIFVLIIAG